MSLADAVLAEDHTVPRDEIAKELAGRGVAAPTYPLPPLPRTEVSDERSAERVQQHDAAVKAFETKWEELRQKMPVFQQAWEAAFTRKRAQAIRECIVTRARREGVTIQ